MVWDWVEKTGRFATDLVTGTAGIVAEGVVAATWNYTGRHVVNGGASVLNRFREEEDQFEDFEGVEFGTCFEGAVKAGRYAWDEPERAGELALQGASNACTSTGGMIVDIGAQLPDMAVNIWDWVLRPVAVGAANLVLPEERHFKYFGDISLIDDPNFREKWPEATTFIEMPAPYLYKVDGDRNPVLNEKGEKIYLRDGDGRHIPNPHVNQERTILFTTQGLVEIPAMAAAAVVTGGAAGVVWGGGRGLFAAGSMGQRVGRIGSTATKFARKGFEFTSPVTTRSMRAKDLADASTSLTKLRNVLDDPGSAGFFARNWARARSTVSSPLGRLQQARLAFAARDANKLSLADKFSNARGALFKTDKSVVLTNRATRIDAKVTDLDKIAKARKAAGQFSGFTTGTGLIVPEIIGLEAATGLGLFSELRKDFQGAAELEQGHAIVQDSAFQELIDTLRTLIATEDLKIGSDDFNDMCGIFDIEPGSDAYNAIIEALENPPDAPSEPSPRLDEGEQDTGYLGPSPVDPGFKLSETANFAYQGQVPGSIEALVDYWKDLDEYRMNVTPKAEILTVG